MTSEFKPVNRLEELLVRAASDPVARPEFYRELLRATLYLLTPEPPVAEGTAIAPAGATLNIVNWRGPCGADHADLQRSRAGRARRPGDGPGERLRRDRGQRGLRHARPATPGRDPESRLSLRQAVHGGGDRPPRGRNGLRTRATREHATDARPPGGSPRCIRRPSSTPSPACSPNGRRSKRPYLAQIHFPDEEAVPHPIVGVLSADYEKDIRDIGLVAKEAYGSTGPVDFLDMRAAREGIAVYLRDKTKPFYVRAEAEDALRKARSPSRSGS